jgi:hypothetical protein
MKKAWMSGDGICNSVYTETFLKEIKKLGFTIENCFTGYGSDKPNKGRVFQPVTIIPTSYFIALQKENRTLKKALNRAWNKCFKPASVKPKIL